TVSDQSPVAQNGMPKRQAAERRKRMKWITRERVKVDRVACPWLIKKFVDPNAEFLFVPTDQVAAIAAREGAIHYDVGGADLGHVERPAHVKPGGFDDAAVHRGTARVYVAHTVNDALDVIDGAVDRYLHSIPGLTGVAGALVSVFSRSLRPMPCNSGRRCRPN